MTIHSSATNERAFPDIPRVTFHLPEGRAIHPTGPSTLVRFFVLVLTWCILAGCQSSEDRLRRLAMGDSPESLDLLKREIIERESVPTLAGNPLVHVIIFSHWKAKLEGDAVSERLYLDLARSVASRPSVLGEVDDGGTNALHVAAQSSLEMTRLCLERGMDPNVPDGSGLTALDHAELLVSDSVEKALIEKEISGRGGVAGKGVAQHLKPQSFEAFLKADYPGEAEDILEVLDEGRE